MANPKTKAMDFVFTWVEVEGIFIYCEIRSAISLRQQDFLKNLQVFHSDILLHSAMRVLSGKSCVLLTMGE